MEVRQLTLYIRVRRRTEGVLTTAQPQQILLIVREYSDAFSLKKLTDSSENATRQIVHVKLGSINANVMLYHAHTIYICVSCFSIWCRF